ncbi:hypothetical protein HYW53_03350 [Candidatus Giovannonibacteria bacterium]|nr:hypothetical protein [Candidatus Giovannonibacteria bacterium]
MNRFGISLFILLFVFWGILVLSIKFLFSPVHGAPAIYEISGCDISRCFYKFYPAGAITDLILIVGSFVGAYFVGKKYKDSLFKKKMSVGFLFFIFLLAINGLIFFFGFQMPLDNLDNYNNVPSLGPKSSGGI